jgi:hypothetical protein
VDLTRKPAPRQHDRPRDVARLQVPGTEKGRIRATGMRARMLSTRTWAFLFAGALATTILLAFAGRFFLGGERMFEERPALELPGKVVVFTLFLVMGFQSLDFSPP